MEERQIWELLSSNMIGLSIFLFGNAFLIWVAFRVSKSVNETGGNILFKIIGSVFGLGVVYNGLVLGGFMSNAFQSTASVSYTHLTLPTKA